MAWNARPPRGRQWPKINCFPSIVIRSSLLCLPGAASASLLHLGLVLDVHRGLFPVKRPAAAAAAPGEDVFQLGTCSVRRVGAAAAATPSSYREPQKMHHFLTKSPRYRQSRIFQIAHFGAPYDVSSHRVWPRRWMPGWVRCRWSPSGWEGGRPPRSDSRPTSNSAPSEFSKPSFQRRRSRSSVELTLSARMNVLSVCTTIEVVATCTLTLSGLGETRSISDRKLRPWPFTRWWRRGSVPAGLPRAVSGLSTSTMEDGIDMLPPPPDAAAAAAMAATEAEDELALFLRKTDFLYERGLSPPPPLDFSFSSTMLHEPRGEASPPPGLRGLNGVEECIR